MTKQNNVRMVIETADEMGMLLELTLTNGTELFGYWVEEFHDDHFVVDCGDGREPNPITVRYDEVAEIDAI